MKKHLLTPIVLLILSAATAQNVGIGTTNPNQSALLDLNSTTRGFLLPRVTTTQMFAIDNPANGLMVFNTTYSQLYHYDGTTWRSVLNGSHWSRPFANRNIMSNISDSIGIGTNLPTRDLDVNGTARVRGTFYADGTISATSMVLSNTVIATTGVFNTSLQTNDQLVISNPAGIIQLRANAEDKAFIQLNGNDLRLGTNSSNDNGKLVIRTNGADRVSVDDEGTMNLSGKLTADRSGAANLLPLCWGLTNSPANGGVRRGTGNISVSRISRGLYRITCPGITENSCVITSPIATGIVIGNLTYDGYVDVYIRKSDTGEDFDQVFNFIIY